MTAKEAFRQAMRTEDEIKIQLARFIERQKGEFSPHTYRAAALIRAQVDGLEYAYLKREWEFVEARLNECRAALAELEAPDGR